MNALPHPHAPLLLAVNAACINTPGSFTCQCFLGFTGNGKVCIADVPAQDAIADKFKTEGKGGQQQSLQACMNHLWLSCEVWCALASDRRCLVTLLAHASVHPAEQHIPPHPCCSHHLQLLARHLPVHRAWLGV